MRHPYSVIRCHVKEMSEMDRSAIDKLGIPSQILIENAGIASFCVLEREIDIRGNSFLVICGNGNNGVDGLADARKLHSEGGRVTVCFVGSPEKMIGAAAVNLSIARSIGIPIDLIESPDSLDRHLSTCDVIIDAILGTGLERDVKGRYANAIEKINRNGKSVVSIDILSGIQGDSGKIMGLAVKANHTVTFGLHKLGNFLYPG